MGIGMVNSRLGSHESWRDLQACLQIPCQTPKDVHIRLFRLAPLLHLPVQACLPRSGVPHGMPLEGQSIWKFVSIMLGCIGNSFFHFNVTMMPCRTMREFRRLILRYSGDGKPGSLTMEWYSPRTRSQCTLNVLRNTSDPIN